MSSLSAHPTSSATTPTVALIEAGFCVEYDRPRMGRTGRIACKIAGSIGGTFMIFNGSGLDETEAFQAAAQQLRIVAPTFNQLETCR